MTTPKPLRALSVKQPWADCIARTEKLIENRTWSTRYRGLLAIHAGKATDGDGFADSRVQQLLCGRTGPGCWDAGITTSPPWAANRGVIVAVAELVDCHPAWRGCCQPWGDQEAYHWALDRVQPLDRPVPVRGQLGVFSLQEITARDVVDQLRAVAR